ncbi:MULTISPECIES: WXG100 family type VII secretion target [unclassified Nonomuraea]|uniref:WXG100 family type VII secretion target n=1 Tax=unclassified Nonomuraea TaxID=2593643 RepID=UPI003402BEB5
MSYEDGKTLYSVALVEATIGAGLIMRPWAFYVELMIGVLISDPGRMSESSKNWRTTDNGGMTSELIAVEGQLKELRTTLTGSGATWEGTARERFDKAYDDFTTSLATLKSTRNATGEAVDQAARLYYMGAKVCVAIASAMVLIGMALAYIRSHPLTGAFGQKITDTFGKAATTSMKKLLIRHGIAVTVLGTLFYQAVQMSESSGKAFPTMKAIPNELTKLKSGNMPEFNGTALDYDESNHALVPKPDPTGGLGGLGRT